MFRTLLWSRLMVLALASFGLAACAGGDSHRGTAADFAAEFQGLEIRRIGNDQVGNREFQNRAISNALRDLQAQGIGRDRIENITVSTTGGQGPGGGFGGFSFNFRYDVWINIKGCDSPVVYRAGPTGGITTSQDRSGCLGTG